MITARSVSILLVEDHNDSLSAMARLLEGSGYVVYPAHTAAEARAFAAVNECDLVLCDLGLPDGTGADLIRELHAAHAWKSIALSGFSETDAAPEAAAAGFDAYLQKPVAFSDLLTAVANLTA